MRLNRFRIAALAGAGALVVGGGTALAGDGDGTRCDRLLAKVAEKRGLTVEQLQAEIRARLNVRIDAALKAGRISEARAAEVRARVAEAKGCAFVARKLRQGRALHRHAVRTMLRAAADYLDLSDAELRAELRSGSTLAEIATKQGKSVDGLEAAMLAPAKARLEAAVASGRITDERRDAIVERLTKLAESLVTKTFAA